MLLTCKVFVHYSGTLKADGKEFDSNLTGEPITFDLGENKVIEGWEQGLLGTCPRESIKLEIPASLGYGEKG
jgi:FKBP-type peptidyl-prolyl cis-trans isomerase